MSSSAGASPGKKPGLVLLGDVWRQMEKDHGGKDVKMPVLAEWIASRPDKVAMFSSITIGPPLDQCYTIVQHIRGKAAIRAAVKALCFVLPAAYGTDMEKMKANLLSNIKFEHSQVKEEDVDDVLRLVPTLAAYQIGPSTVLDLAKAMEKYQPFQNLETVELVGYQATETGKKIPNLGLTGHFVEDCQYMLALIGAITGLGRAGSPRLHTMKWKNFLLNSDAVDPENKHHSGLFNKDDLATNICKTIQTFWISARAGLELMSTLRVVLSHLPILNKLELHKDPRTPAMLIMELLRGYPFTSQLTKFWLTGEESSIAKGNGKEPELPDTIHSAITLGCMEQFLKEATNLEELVIRNVGLYKQKPAFQKHAVFLDTVRAKAKLRKMTFENVPEFDRIGKAHERRALLYRVNLYANGHAIDNPLDSLKSPILPEGYGEPDWAKAEDEEIKVGKRCERQWSYDVGSADDDDSKWFAAHKKTMAWDDGSIPMRDLEYADLWSNE